MTQKKAALPQQTSKLLFRYDYSLLGCMNHSRLDCHFNWTERYFLNEILLYYEFVNVTRRKKSAYLHVCEATAKTTKKLEFKLLLISLDSISLGFRQISHSPIKGRPLSDCLSGSRINTSSWTGPH